MSEALLSCNEATANTKSPPFPTLAAGIVIVSLVLNPVPPFYIVTAEAAPPDTVTLATKEAATPLPDVAFG